MLFCPTFELLTIEIVGLHVTKFVLKWYAYFLNFCPFFLCLHDGICKPNFTNSSRKCVFWGPGSKLTKLLTQIINMFCNFRPLNIGIIMYVSSFWSKYQCKLMLAAVKKLNNWFSMDYCFVKALKSYKK